jgi:hypothetical protein
MRSLGVPDLLVAWESAYGQPPALRALTLITAASADEDVDLRGLPLGERDARLLTLREATFGPSLESLAECSSCGEKFEFSLNTPDVRAPARPSAGPPLTIDGYEVEWRLPTAGDVAALARDEVTKNSALRLLEACVVHARRGDVSVAPADLPEPVRAALAQAVERADPHADLALQLDCPACTHPNVVPFDIATFFWDELNVWALRTLQDVHALASAYGWSEREVLSMSSFRRQLYLEMVGA